MGKARRRFRIGFGVAGITAASLLILGQAGATRAPAAASASPAAVAAATASTQLPAAARSSPQNNYSAESFRKLKVKVAAAPLRLSPTLKADATLALGPIRFPDGALKLPGRIRPETPEAVRVELTEVGRSVSVPTAIRMAEVFEIYSSEDAASRGAFGGFAGLISPAHAQSAAHTEALGGPLSRMPIEGHILFHADKEAISSDGQALLDKLVETLRGSHASLEVVAYGGKRGSKSSDARRLSLRRGLAVRSYLISRGIDKARISVRPMGGVLDDGPEARVDVFYASY